MPSSAPQTPARDGAATSAWGHALAIAFAAITLALGVWLVLQVRAQAGSPAAPGMRAIDSVPAGWLVAIGVAFAALAAAPWRPVVGLWAYVALALVLPRYSAASFAVMKTQTLTWFAGLALAGWAVHLLRRRQRPDPVNTWLLGAMLAFIAWLGVSAVAAMLRNQPWNPHPNHHPLLFVQALCMFLLASQMLRHRPHAGVFCGVVGASLMARWIISGSAGIDTEGDISALSVLAMPLAALGAATCRGRAGKLAFAALGLGLVVLLSQTNNRGAAIAFIVMLPVWWLVSTQKKRLLLGTIPLILAMGLLLANDRYRQRFAAIFEESPQDKTSAQAKDSVQSRLVMWEAAWRMAKANPVTGVGVGDFHNRVQMYANPDQPAKPVSRPAAHNNLMHVLGEAGFPGAALYLCIFLAALALMLLAARRLGDAWPGPAARMIAVAIVVYLAIGLFISRHDMVMGYLLAGWAAGVAAMGTSRRSPVGTAGPTRPTG